MPPCLLGQRSTSPSSVRGRRRKSRLEGVRTSIARSSELRELREAHRSDRGWRYFRKIPPGRGFPVSMIPRYSRPEMARIWEPEAKFRIWLAIETYAAEAMAELGQIPKE